ncbi:MAG: hypothetical protein V4487_01515 [Chlamydiota bacterium]
MSSITNNLVDLTNSPPPFAISTSDNKFSLFSKPSDINVLSHIPTNVNFKMPLPKHVDNSTSSNSSYHSCNGKKTKRKESENTEDIRPEKITRNKGENFFERKIEHLEATVDLQSKQINTLYENHTRALNLVDQQSLRIISLEKETEGLKHSLNVLQLAINELSKGRPISSILGPTDNHAIRRGMKKIYRDEIEEELTQPLGKS